MIQVDAETSRLAPKQLRTGLSPEEFDKQLTPGTDKHASRLAEGDHWQFVFLLSKLVGAILSSDGHIMICLDDLQWCDSTMIGLISEVLISVSQR